MNDKKPMSNLPLNRRRFVQGTAALGAGVMAHGMPLSQAIWAAQGKVLKARSYSDINKLDPGFYQNAYNVDVMNCIYSKLIKYEPGTEWGWGLQAAESIEQVDDTHIRFKLRPGIMFTGGYGEMTAEDVKFSFERIIEHDSPDRFLTHEGSPVMYRTSVMEPATRPDGRPLYRDFKPKSM